MAVIPLAEVLSESECRLDDGKNLNVLGSIQYSI